MARLYVVNCTGQQRVVNYRLDFTVDDMGRRTSERMVPYRTMTIPPRAQVQFGGDFHPMQIQEIIGQLEATCGAVPVSDVKTAKRMGVVKMIWSEDKPVPRPILEDVVHHNVQLLSEQGAERRRMLALAADQQMNQLIEGGIPKLEMEFESVGDDPESSSLEEGLRVKRTAPTTPRSRGSKGSRRAA